ncbi:hypothetical protein [Halorubrum pallidum]|uniref:Uncharacterized protein n=1 Tax=Halorubrum pallidum TaxID=1526114 RepID=A0ABD5T2V4_9EURY
MPSERAWLSRRRFIGSAAATLSAPALSGCGGSGSSSGSTSSDDPDAEPPDDALRAPPHVTLRGSTTEPNIVMRESTESGTGDSPNERDDWAQYVLSGDDDADALTFAEVEGVDEARAFLDQTEFDSETVYVERHLVGECYRHRLCWVRWTRREIETDYARVLRDVDVACEADARVAVTNLIRLPVALDSERISSYSSGGGSGACPRPTEDDRREGDSS